MTAARLTPSVTMVSSPTEERNPRTLEIDTASTLDVLRLINAEDELVPSAVAAVLPQLAVVVDRAVDALRGGHRVHYFGAGTSGRVGVQDAAELMPTFDLEPNRVVAHHAGGVGALVMALEDVEDDAGAGWADAEDVDAGDVVVGLAASGRTPYVLSALTRSRAAGAFAVLVSANPDASAGADVDVHVGLDTGPEVIAGSTRMKAATAQKLVLHSLSTAVMVRLGRNEDALAAFQEVVRHQPNNPVALIDTATLLLKLGRYDDARDHAALASQAAPASAHELLAKIALARKKPDDALREAALAEQADPALPMSDYIRGLIAHEQGDLAQRAGSSHRARQKYGEALPLLMRAHDRAARRAMQIAELGYYIGDCLGQLERYEEAERFFKEEIALYPNSLRARTGLAMMYEASGRTSTAEQTIGAMLAAVPTPDAYRQAAELWRVFGHPERQAATLAASRARFRK